MPLLTLTCGNTGTLTNSVLRLFSACLFFALEATGTILKSGSQLTTSLNYYRSTKLGPVSILSSFFSFSLFLFLSFPWSFSLLSLTVLLDKVHSELFGPYQQIETSFQTGHGLVGSAANSRSPVWLTEVDPSGLGHHASMITSVGIHSGMSVPIVYGGKVLAVIAFFSLTQKGQVADEIDQFYKYVIDNTASAPSASFR